MELSPYKIQLFKPSKQRESERRRERKDSLSLLTHCISSTLNILSCSPSIPPHHIRHPPPHAELTSPSSVPCGPSYSSQSVVHLIIPFFSHSLSPSPSYRRLTLFHQSSASRFLLSFFSEWLKENRNEYSEPKIKTEQDDFICLFDSNADAPNNSSLW